MNCGQAVDTGHMQLFGGAYVCPVCYGMADHFVKRADNELHKLRVLLHEGVRNALVTGGFHYNPATPVARKEVLEKVIALQDAVTPRATSDGCLTPKAPATQSGDSTPPHVATLAAMGQESTKKLKAQD